MLVFLCCNQDEVGDGTGRLGHSVGVIAGLMGEVDTSCCEAGVAGRCWVNHRVSQSVCSCCP